MRANVEASGARERDAVGIDGGGERGNVGGLERGKMKQLPSEVQSRMRSSCIIACIGQLCEELVCNSIDAGATEISVVIDTGSTLSAIVSDNGCGLGVGDVHLVGGRYFTSKMNSVSDLERGVTTLGFRGEALSSVSDMCILEVTSRAAGSFETFTRISKVRSTPTFVQGIKGFGRTTEKIHDTQMGH